MAISSSLVSAILIVLVAISVRYWEHNNTHAPLPEDRLQRRFLQWFHDNDGWMDAHLGLTSIDGFGSGLTAHADIDKYNQIMLVPERIQISKESAVKEFRRLAPQQAEMMETFAQLDQDEVIALALLVQSCLGEHSFFEPYLSVLPKETEPLLFSFDESELELLQDEMLANLARETSARIHSVWSELVEPSARLLAKHAIMETQGLSFSASDSDTASCLTEATFSRFYAICSSHCMILDGTKYLVPMADMINHNPSMDAKTDESFESFHNKEAATGGSVSIAVHADRKIPAESQLFEEYGKLDNSLYLVSFGFVPTDNPYHCAVFPAKNFPTLDDPVLAEILQSVDPSWETVGSVCVHRDGSPLERVPYLALHALQSNDEARQHCIDSYASGDRQRIEQACIHHGLVAIDTTNKLFESAARAVLEMAATTLEQDLVVLAQLEADSDLGVDTRRKVLAVRFRIEEKRLAQVIAGSLSDQKMDL
jgi:hypothetical protein